MRLFEYILETYVNVGKFLKVEILRLRSLNVSLKFSVRLFFYVKESVLMIDVNRDDDALVVAALNVQHKRLSLLEQIKTYGILYRVKKHQGRKNNDVKGISQNICTAMLVGKIAGVNYRTIQRYSSLLNLTENLLAIVGNKRENAERKKILSMRAGECISHLSREQQEIIEQFLNENKSAVITISQAKELKKKFHENPNLSKDDICNLLLKSKSELVSSELRADLLEDKLLSYFPGKSKTEAIDQVCSFLDNWSRAGKPDTFDIVEKH